MEWTQQVDDRSCPTELISGYLDKIMRLVRGRALLLINRCRVVPQYLSGQEHVEDADWPKRLLTASL